MALFGSSISREIKKYQKKLSKEPGDPRLHVKIGDLYLKDDKKDQAIENYRNALNIYLQDGYPLKAIAITKIILKIKPESEDLQELLKDLYRKAGFATERAGRKDISAEEMEEAVAEAPEPAEFEEPAEEVPIELPEEAEAPEAETPIDLPEEADLSVEEAPEEVMEEVPEEAQEEVPIELPEEVEPPEEEAAIEPPPETVEEEGVPQVKSLLFSELSETEFIQVVKKLKSVTVPKGEFVCQEGEEGDSIYVIVSGRVRIIKTTPEGKQIVITKLSEGDVFGEFGYFQNSKRTASVKTEVDTEVFEIVKSEFDELIKDYPRIADVLDEFFRERMIDTIMALSPLFSSLNSKERKDIRDRFTFKVFKPGEKIITQGEMTNSLYIIKEGTVEVISEAEGEEPEVTETLEQGGFFGEIAAVTGVARTASVVARTDTEVMELVKDSFDEMLMDYPQIVDVLQEYARARIDDILVYFEFISKADELKEGLI